MSAFISSRTVQIWDSIPPSWKESAGRLSVAGPVALIAYTLIGKKALLLFAAIASLSFYYKDYMTELSHSVTVISAVISLPLCCFFGSPLLMVPSSVFLASYILKNNREQNKLIAVLEKEIRRLQEETSRLTAVDKKGEIALLRVNKLIDSSKQRTQRVTQIKEQEQEGLRLSLEAISEAGVQEKIRAAQTAHDEVKKLTTALAKQPAQADATLLKMQRLTTCLGEMIDLLNKLIAQKKHVT